MTQGEEETLIGAMVDALVDMRPRDGDDRPLSQSQAQAYCEGLLDAHLHTFATLTRAPVRLTPAGAEDLVRSALSAARKRREAW